MGNIEKTYRKRESINPPLRIKSVVLIVATVAGFCVWGIGFIWAVLGLYLCWNILKGILSCLLSLACLAGFFYFLFTYIF
jgi:hypothetical protein